MFNDISEIDFLTKAAERGNDRSQCELGRLHLKGDEGVKEDLPKAAMWLRRAAEQGNAQAQNLLGYVLIQGKGVTQNKEEALKWYLKSAEQGNAGSQFTLGVMYAFGEGVTRDIKEAYTWLFLAGQSGQKDYQEFEEKIKRELPADERRLAQEKAEQWLQDRDAKLEAIKTDAAQGNIRAQYDLAEMHLNGKGVQKSIEEGVRLLELAAEGGYATAQNTLGRELLEVIKLTKLVANQQGHGNLPDLQSSSVKMIKEADSKPDFRIRNDVGILLLEGTEVADPKEVDKKMLEAIDWLEKAAYQGNPYAQYNRASIYLQEKYLIKAYSWICLAARSKYEHILDAKEQIEQILKEELTEDEILAAKREYESLAQQVKDPNMRH